MKKYSLAKKFFMKEKISKGIKSAAENFNKLITDDNLKKNLYKITSLCIKAFKNDQKLLLCGNGGSASDAQHIAAELSGKFYFDRLPLNAEALHVNSSFMTAVANDFGYEETYARMIEASGKKGDVLIAISTSGNSSNIIKAVSKANELGLVTIGFTGLNGGKLNDMCDIILRAPNNDTPRVQETHILFGHIICQIIEEEMFSNI